jgi:hypothetical protein
LSSLTTRYIQRRLVKIMESLTVNNNGVVRSTQDNTYLTAQYGGDGYDPRYLEHVTLPTVMMSDSEIAQRYTDDDAVAIVRLRDNIRAARRRNTHLDPGGTELSRVTVPCNPTRTIHAVSTQVRATGGVRVTCADSHAALRRLQDRAVDISGKLNSVHLRAVLGDALRWDVVRHLTPEQLVEVERRLFDRMRRAKVEAGMLVGAIAAHSIGEPWSVARARCISTRHASPLPPLTPPLSLPLSPPPPFPKYPNDPQHREFNSTITARGTDRNE